MTCTPHTLEVQTLGTAKGGAESGKAAGNPSRKKGSGSSKAFCSRLSCAKGQASAHLQGQGLRGGKRVGIGGGVSARNPGLFTVEK